MEMFFSFVNLIAHLALKRSAQMVWKPVVPLIGLSNCCRNDSQIWEPLPSPTCQNQHRAFNFQASVHCVRRCLVVSRPCGCEDLSRKKNFQKLILWHWDACDYL